VIKWDKNSWSDCRPSEADAIQDEIIELATALNVGPMLIKDLGQLEIEQYKELPRCLQFKWNPRKGPLVYDWPLDEANSEARRICQQALDNARRGYPNLKLAEEVWFEYENEGLLDDDGKYEGLEDFSDRNRRDKILDHAQGEDGVYRCVGYKTVDAIGWGDKNVIDTEHCTTNADDGAMSFSVRTIHFADPYGCEAFNVVELVIKVEVVPSETEKAV